MKIKFSWGPASFAASLAALVLSLGGTGYALTAAGHAAPAAGHAAPAAAPAWHVLRLENNWQYGTSDSYHAAFYKDSQGVVHLRGSASGGAYGSVVFQLPTGDRPSHSVYLTIYAVHGSAGGLEIKPNGDATVFDDNNNFNRNVFDFSSFDGVTFRVP